MTTRPRVLAVLLAGLAAPPARAAFDDAAFGARDAAMGSAFSAVHDEAGAVAHNPASLGHAPALEAAVSHAGGLHWPAGNYDRDVTRAAGAFPVRQELLDGAFGMGVRYDRRARVAKDREIGLFYGTRGLHETADGGTMDVGVGLKLLQSSLDSGGATGTKPALDLGGLWRVSDRRSLAVSLLNFGGAKFSGGGYADRAPLALKLGAAETVHGALIALDATVREPSGGQARSQTLSAGFERWWPTARAGSFAGRSGLSIGNLSKSWTAGAGWRQGGARVDYALGVPLTGVTRFSHAVSVSVRFGRADPETEYARLLEGEMEQRRRLGRSLEAGEVRQQALAEEIGRLRDDLAELRQELARRTSSEEDARKRLRELEGRHQKAVDTYNKLKEQRERQAAKTRAELFQDDWRAYQKAKLDGAPDAALAERLRRLLVEYRDAGVDLGEANQELRRLQF